jgi:hypothetical protein
LREKAIADNEKPTNPQPNELGAEHPVKSLNGSDCPSVPLDENYYWTTKPNDIEPLSLSYNKPSSHQEASTFHVLPCVL